MEERKLVNVSDVPHLSITEGQPKTPILAKTKEWIERKFGIVVMWILIGMFLGSFISYKFFQWRINESIQVGGFVYEHKVYDITERLLKK
jgi:hypothetical protein